MSSSVAMRCFVSSEQDLANDLPLMITQERQTIRTPNNKNSNRGHLAADFDELTILVSFSRQIE
jgi:hypothetical protein